MSSRSSWLPGLVTWRVFFAGTAIFAAGTLFRGFFIQKPRANVIESPRTTLLPKLSETEKSKLPYPPDVLPGARDVSTPYGSIRVYEFGPENGRKVLLVHGISTPCISLGAVAHCLAENGCRVMLFDLFGRGYSDTPADLEHDVRLFTTQILLALASSPLSWTGASSGKFSMIGYSLGGGISADFTSYFPELVDSLILIAPAGLIRPYHISRSSRIMYSQGVVPEAVLHRLIRGRLKRPLRPSKQPQPDGGEKMDATAAVQAEANIESNPQVPLSQSHPDITVEKAVAHQVDHHGGFVHAFMSSIRYGPIQDRHPSWRLIGQRLSQQSREKGTPHQVLIIGGDNDAIILKDELQEDAAEALEGNAEFRFINAGHEVPISKGDEVAQYILQFWG